MINMANSIKIFAAITLLFLFSVKTTGQIDLKGSTTNGSVVTGSRVIFTPQKPKYGDKIQVVFIPGEKSPVVRVDSLYMDVMFIYKNGSSITDEYLMLKNGSFWTTSFVLSNQEAGAMAIQFATPDFRSVDCNSEKAWDLMVYGEDGNPVKGAYHAFASGYMAHGLIQRRQDMEKYSDGMNKELERFPEDPLNLVYTWFYRKMPGELSKVKRETDSLFQKYPNNLKVLEALYSQYVNTRDTTSSNKVLSRIKAIDPKNQAAIFEERGKIFFNKADRNKLDKLYNLVKEAEGTKVFETLQRDYFQNLVWAKYYERAAEFLKEWEKPDWNAVLSSARRLLIDNSRVNFYSPNFELYSRLPLKEDEEKLRAKINISIAMTNFGIKGYQNAKVSDRDKYEVPSAWYSQRKGNIGMAYCNLALAHQVLNQVDSAFAKYEIAKRILGNEFYFFGGQTYFSLLLSLNKNQKAFDEAKVALSLSPYNKEVYYKILRNASDTPQREKEAEELIKKYKTNFAGVRQKEIASNFLTKPESAKDFSLAELNGNLISLSSLKGKVVIIEFWDTYCGWCLKSFEKLHPFYEKHKNDSDFVFVTINTNPPSDAKVNNIKDYMKEHKFTFPVLIDAENKVVSAYKLFGTPQTLVINRAGDIIYKESGYGGPTIAGDLEKIIDKVKETK